MKYREKMAKNLKLTIFKEKINQNKQIIGTMIQNFRDPILVKILADIGMDFVVLDNEHGAFSYEDVESFATVARDLDIAILVRSAKLSYEYLAKMLDMGADGLMIPHIDNVSEVNKIVEFSKYPPIGNRSYGMRKYLSKLYHVENSAEFIKLTNESTVIFIQVESLESANNIDKLLENPHIDGVIIGPADFTMNMGIIGQYKDEKFIEYCSNVLDCCKKHKIFFGIHVSKKDLLKYWIEKGANILLYSNITNFIKESAEKFINETNIDN